MCKDNPLVELLSLKASGLKYMGKDEVISILDASDYYDDASAMAMKIIG